MRNFTPRRSDHPTDSVDQFVSGIHRRAFLDPGEAFWPSTKGAALSYTYVGMRITEIAQRELGHPVNPHLYRDCAVHTVATHIGQRMGVASALLQHADRRTTEQHYNKGAGLHAAQGFIDLVVALEEKGR